MKPATQAEPREPDNAPPERRHVRDIFYDLENLHHDLSRLALVLIALGGISENDEARPNTSPIMPAVEVMGEVIRERAERLSVLIDEGCAATPRPIRG